MSADRKTFLPLWAFPLFALAAMVVALLFGWRTVADTCLGTAIATAFVAALYTFVPIRTRR